MRSGDFSAVPNLTLRNPFTGLAVPGNVIPSSLINPGCQELAGPFLSAAELRPATSTVATIVRRFPNRSVTTSSISVSITQSMSNNNIYARVSYKRSEPRVLDGGLPAELTGYRVQTRMARQVAISDTWTVTPRLINEFKLGFARNFNPARGELLGQEMVDMLGIQGLQPAPE